MKLNTWPIDPSLLELIQKLEQRIEVLEHENIETTNVLYEIMNSIDAVDARIDILVGEPLNLQNYSLGDT